MTMLEANERLEQWIYDNSVEITPELLACAHVALENYIAQCKHRHKHTRTICVIEGGLLTAVYSDDKALDVELLDYDNMKMCQPIDGESNDEYDGYKELEDEIKSGALHCVW